MQAPDRAVGGPADGPCRAEHAAAPGRFALHLPHSCWLGHAGSGDAGNVVDVLKLQALHVLCMKTPDVQHHAAHWQQPRMGLAQQVCWQGPQ